MLSITVQEALKRPSFSDITILSGRDSLTRSFKWVHVIEKVDCSRLIDGGELILSTGIEWNKSEETALYFLQQLLDKNVAALCIELEDGLNSLPSSFIELADDHNFPIILFNEEVKFVTITQDLHRFLLEFEDTIWNDLETLFIKLNAAFVENKQIGDFLKILHQTLHEQVVFKQVNGQVWSFPLLSDRDRQRVESELQRSDNPYISAGVSSLNQEVGTIYLLKEKQFATKFEFISLTRCATFIGQSLLLTSQHQETRQLEENEWIKEILHESPDHQTVLNQLKKIDHLLDPNEISVAVIPLDSTRRGQAFSKKSLSYIMLSLRSIMNQNGFQIFATPDFHQNFFILLIINQRGRKDVLDRFKKAAREIGATKNKSLTNVDVNFMSVGIFVKDFSKLAHSYETAMKTYNHQKGKILLYQDLHINRLLGIMENNMEVEEIIRDYIGPIIEYDRNHRLNLLNTLELYLKNQCSKKQTAEELYIVRQTLYHRLEKIENLLNYDITTPQNRFMCEFAIYAFKYNDVE
ncbi:purine catabolism regulatory protein [Oceanobacillus limi]|uniref:Purine catabolism regulatory protein n=1 Tax=Oceanobacillus limi TaxID=930131 RepID=A0A1I0ABK7_9BACI|nr:PucR family transcriptional regulator [Oceanobacillus limi]SES91614.1 purine catabolism regulatory protein [Oceanobacillus limi]